MQNIQNILNFNKKKKIKRFLKRGLLSSHVDVGAALLTFYANCGNVESARIIFDDMGKKSTVTWSAMICDYEIQGDGRGSLSIFGDMLKAELKPNEEIDLHIHLIGM